LFDPISRVAMVASQADWVSLSPAKAAVQVIAPGAAWNCIDRKIILRDGEHDRRSKGGCRRHADLQFGARREICDATRWGTVLEHGRTNAARRVASPLTIVKLQRTRAIGHVVLVIRCV
jgi:hypothetical protein